MTLSSTVPPRLGPPQAQIDRDWAADLQSHAIAPPAGRIGDTDIDMLERRHKALVKNAQFMLSQAEKAKHDEMRHTNAALLATKNARHAADSQVVLATKHADIMRTANAIQKQLDDAWDHLLVEATVSIEVQRSQPDQDQ